MKYNTNLSEDIDRVLNGTYGRREMVYISDTPELLQMIGLKNLPILMTQKHVRDCLAQPIASNKHNHGLDRDYMNNLPKNINEPSMILNSLTSPNESIVLVTDSFDYKNDPNIIALLNNGKGMYELVNGQGARIIDSNILTSTYGRVNFEDFLNRTIFSNGLIFYDNKKSQSLLNTVAVQSRKGIINFDSNTIIHNINKKVNSFGQKIYFCGEKVMYADTNSAGITKIMSGYIDEHVLGDGKLNYMINDCFVQNENIVREEELMQTKQAIAKENVKHIQTVLQNADMPSRLKSTMLHNSMFENGNKIFTIKVYDDSNKQLHFQEDVTKQRYAMQVHSFMQESYKVNENTNSQFKNRTIANMKTQNKEVER